MDHGAFVASLLICNIFILRTSDPVVFAQYTLLYTLYLVVYAFYNSIILEPFSVFITGKLSKFNTSYYNSLLNIQLRNFLRLWPIIIILLLVYFILTGHEVEYKYFILPLVFFLPLLWKYCRVSLYSHNKEKICAIAGFTYIVSIFSGILLIYYYNKYTAVNILFIIHCSYIIPLAIGLFYNKNKQNGLTLKKSYWTDHFKYSKWIIGVAFVMPFCYNIYYWLLGYYNEYEIIAELRAIVQINGILSQIFVAIHLILLKDFGTVIKNENRLILTKKVIKFILVGISIVTVVYIPFIYFGEDIIYIIYGEYYVHICDSIKYGMILNIITFANYVLNIVIKSLAKSYLIFFAYLIASLVTISFGCIMLLDYGYIGAIYGMILSEIAILIYFSIYLISKKVLIWKK